MKRKARKSVNRKIKLLDPVHCKANADAREVIKHALAFQSKFWKTRDNGFGKEIQLKNRYLISGRKNTAGHFLTGLLPRVKRFCRSRGIDIKIDKNNLEKIKPTSNPNLNGIKFRPDQIKAIKAIKRIQRGKIIAPTGSGKTIVALGTISMFPTRKVIFIVDTKDLLMQTVDEANIYSDSLPPVIGPNGVQELEIEIKKLRKSKSGLVICLIQSLAKIKIDDYIDLFDIIVIDECHAVNNLKSRYGKFLQNNLAPRRYGFTASDSFNEPVKALVNEGLLGPVIAELTKEEAIEKGIIAAPTVRLVSIPYKVEVKNLAKNTYHGFYRCGIVENKIRNGIIIEIVRDLIAQKMTSLIIVEKLPHGEILQTLIKKRLKIHCPFVQGKSPMFERRESKENLKKEHIPVVIASRVWMQGINIPTLRAIIYAAGYKEKKKVIQAMGRGLRTSDGKDKIILYDFLDPYRYLAEHSVFRVQTFVESGWI